MTDSALIAYWEQRRHHRNKVWAWVIALAIVAALIAWPIAEAVHGQQAQQDRQNEMTCWLITGDGVGC